MLIPEVTDLMLNLFIIVLGLLVGSFLNVVIHRVPEKQSIAYPPSGCPNCGHRIRWFENIPVFSYLALRGRCAGCKQAISIRYPVVELLTALLFLAVKNRFGISPLLFIRDLPFVGLLVAITFIDLQHRIIPDVLSLGGLVLGLATSYWDPLGIVGSVAGAALGFFIFYGTAWFYAWRTGRSGLGGGDIKLLAMLGAFVGVEGVIITILLSSIVGTVVGIATYLVQRRNTVDPAVTPATETLEEISDAAPTLMKYSIPYGPFLVIGALYAYLLSEVLWSPFMNLT